MFVYLWGEILLRGMVSFKYLNSRLVRDLIDFEIMKMKMKVKLMIIVSLWRNILL